MAVQISGNDITVPRDGTFSRNVSIAGTLTYEDVTNVDSIGLVTARNGIEVGASPGVAASISVDGNAIFSGITTIGGNVKVGTGITLSPDGDAFHTGVVTATSFKGDGSQLSNITSTTINNNADNRLITGSGTANTLEAESNLTYNGGTTLTQTLDDNTTYSATATPQMGFQAHNQSDTTNSFSALRLTAGSSSPATAQISSLYTGAGQNDLTFQLESSNTAFEALRIHSSGNVTKPNNFHLLVNLSQNYTVQNASTVATDLVKWDRVITAQSSSGASSYFNTSTHLFTAPVDGVYLFHIAINCDFNVEFGWLVIDGSRSNYTVVCPRAANQSSTSLTHKLTANQTVGVKWYQNGNTNADFFSDDLHTWWKINLLG